MFTSGTFQHFEYTLHSFYTGESENTFISEWSTWASGYYPGSGVTLVTVHHGPGATLSRVSGNLDTLMLRKTLGKGSVRNHTDWFNHGSGRIKVHQTYHQHGLGNVSTGITSGGGSFGFAPVCPYSGTGYLAHYFSFSDLTSGANFATDSIMLQQMTGTDYAGGAIPIPGLQGTGMRMNTAPVEGGLNNPGTETIYYNSRLSSGISTWFWFKLVTGASATPEASYTLGFLDKDNNFEQQLAITISPAGASIIAEHDTNIQTTDDVYQATGHFAPVTGNWYLLGMSWDRIHQQTKLYINGVSTFTVSDPSNPPDSYSGQLQFFNTSSGPDPYLWYLDELGMTFNGPLSDAQWSGIWNGGSGFTYPGITGTVPALCLAKTWQRKTSAKAKVNITAPAGPNLSGSFSNCNGVTIYDDTIAGPYPSYIVVTGFTGNVSNVTVTLSGYSHTSPSDVRMLLVSPDNREMQFYAFAGSSSQSNAILTFSDAATGTWDGVVSSGTFLPTLPDGTSTMTAPAPGDTYSTVLSGLNGANPNGAWALYIEDTVGGDSGTLTCWTLNMTTKVPAPALAAYWTLNGPTGNQLDSISGLSMVRAYTAGGTSKDSLTSGILGSGLRIDTVGGSHNGVDFSTAASSQIGFDGNGFSVFGWFNANIVTNAGAIPFMEYFYFNNIRLRWFDTFMTADCSDDNSTAAVQNISYSSGTWHMFHFFYDPLAQQLGFSLDAAAPTRFGSSIIFGGNPQMLFELDLSDLFSSNNEIAWDEIGVVSGGYLSTGQVSSIFNGGSGVTYPAITGIVPH